jgi:CRP/FNR family cyclic AMP-dependent transcriptional regulator
MKTPATTPQLDQPAEASDKPGSFATKTGNDPSQSLYTLIGQQPFFKGLNDHQLQLLTDSAMEMRFEAGQSILQAGSPANRFYLILEGKVALESEVADRGMILIQTLGPGDDLGWSWLFAPYYVHLDARALEPTRTIFFYGTRLREQCEQDHDLGYELMKRIAEVATQCLQATQQRLAKCADTRDLQA